MKVAQLDENGIFVGIVELDESDRNPIDRDEWMIPGGCIETIPEKIQPGHIAIWDGNTYLIESVSDIVNGIAPVSDSLRKAIQLKQLGFIQSVISRRNSLLESTDWTQLRDVPQSTSNKWKNYRKELRDITQQEGFPSNIVWPQAPE